MESSVGPTGSETKLSDSQIYQFASSIAQGDYENLTVSLAEWQKTELLNITRDGIHCLLRMWFQEEPQLVPGY